jgi:hypothetical protein
MEQLLDGLKEIIVAVMIAAGTFVAFVTRRLYTYGSRLKVLEQTVKGLVERLPGDLREMKDEIARDFGEIKDTIGEMREEARVGREKLYDHVDAVRRELRQDMKDAEVRRRAR